MAILTLEKFLSHVSMLILCLCITTSCVGSPQINISPTLPKAEVISSTAMLARLEGKLMMIGNCLRVVNNDSVGVLLLWTINWKVSVQDNKVHITDEGMVTGIKKNYDYLLGDNIILGGGGGSWDESSIPTSMYQVSSPMCSRPYFEVSMIGDH